MCNQCHLLQEGRTGINPMSCALHLTLLTLNTNLNFFKGALEINLFLRRSDLFDSLKIPID